MRHILLIGSILSLLCVSCQTVKPTVKGQYAHLDVLHRSQGHDQCLPTCAAMVAGYYGDDKSAWTLKSLANPSKNVFTGTTPRSMVQGVEQLGYRWYDHYFKPDSAGFMRGLQKLKQSLDEKHPAIIGIFIQSTEGLVMRSPSRNDPNIDLPIEGQTAILHAIVITGYDEKEKEVFALDPAKKWPGKRTISYADLENMWNNGKNSSRTLIVTAPRSM